MIIDKDTNPTRDIYYLGAVLLEILDQHSSKRVDFFDVFNLLVRKQKISMGLFVLTIDWLFLLGCIQSQDGVIEKCF